MKLTDQFSEEQLQNLLALKSRWTPKQLVEEQNKSEFTPQQLARLEYQKYRLEQGDYDEDLPKSQTGKENINAPIVRSS
jgi:hypothetical protein